MLAYEMYYVDIITFVYKQDTQRTHPAVFLFGSRSQGRSLIFQVTGVVFLGLVII